MKMSFVLLDVDSQNHENENENVFCFVSCFYYLFVSFLPHVLHVRE